MNPDLQGKVALVTGGAWDVAEVALARAAGGAAVAVNDRTSADEALAIVETITAMNGCALAYEASVADYGAASRWSAKLSVVGRFGGLNILAASTQPDYSHFGRPGSGA